MKPILIGTVCQLKTFLRIKKALFFSFFFPSFMFVIFSLTWGRDNIEYSYFLFTGIIVVTIMSDSLFSIGNVIIEYYQKGLIKFFKSSPYRFGYHLSSLFLSRIIIIVLSCLLLFIVAYFFSEVTLSFKQLVNILIGIISGMSLFSLLGVVIAETTRDYSGNTNIMNFILFSLIFLSDTFYPLSEINPIFINVVRFNPITSILNIARGNSLNLLPACIWISAVLAIHIVYLYKGQIKR